VVVTTTPRRPFRFTAQVPDPAGSVSGWRKQLDRLEDMGFSTVALADHFTGGYTLEPLVLLTAVAMENPRLRVQTAVLGNDYRHPVLTHRMAATLDMLSEGRLELGIGAGWMRSDYTAAGLRYDPAGERIARLEESIEILKGLFSGDSFTFTGAHFTVTDLVGVPAAVQRPHPPLLVGGGGPKMLRLVGRVADIAGINANLSAGDIGGQSVADVSWERMEQKIGWVREGAESAGRSFGDIELSMATWLLHVTDDGDEAAGLLSKIAARVGVQPEWLDDAPGVLVGSPARCAEKLRMLRDRLGISYVQVFAGPRGVDLTGVGRVVADLAGS
jgi:probable F420-dependent oxidoreductase